MALELRRRGHEVRILTGFPDSAPLSDDARTDSYEVDGLKVYRFRHARAPMGGQSVLTELDVDNYLASAYFARILAEFTPDLVHFFHFSRLGVGLVDMAVKAGVPAYYTPTDFWAVCQQTRLALPSGEICAGPSPYAGNCAKHLAELTQRPAVGRAIRCVPDAAADLAVKFTVGGKLPEYPFSAEVAALSKRKDFVVARLNQLNGIAAPTRMMADTLTRYGVASERIVNLSYGIEVSENDASLATLDKDEALKIGFIGTLAPHKGCHVLIDAFKRLPAGKARLNIYGRATNFPEYYTDLQARAADMPAIGFCGEFPPAEIGNILAGLHVLVVPSLWNENAPLVVYSALAAKRPVIASNLPGLSETIQDCWNGLLFAAGQVTVLEERLSRLIANRGLLNTLSRNCYKPKTTSIYVEELLALYARGPLQDIPKHEKDGLASRDPVAGTV